MRHRAPTMNQLPPPFEIETVTAGVPAGTAVLALSGELDISATAPFRAAVESAAGTERLVLDLAEVTFMDSSMLKELLRARGELHDRGGEVVVVAPQAPVRRLLEVTRTGELMRLVADRETALG